MCGAWGTLAVGLFSADVALGPQLLGVGIGFLWAFPVSFLIFTAIKLTIGLRVSEQEEAVGLDLSEHGMAAYPSPLFGDSMGPAGAASKQVVRKKQAPTVKPKAVAAN